MVIDNVRVDWLNVFQPGSKGKYGVAIMLPKGSPQEAKVLEAIERAKAAGIAKNMFTAAQAKAISFKGCIHDGDAEFETGERAAHYKAHSYINANNKEKPGIVDPRGQKVIDPSPYFSGWYAHVDVNFAPFNNESKGIGCYINHIMFYKPGERLDGRTAVEDAFKGFVPEDGGAGETLE